MRVGLVEMVHDDFSEQDVVVFILTVFVKGFTVLMPQVFFVHSHRRDRRLSPA
jgi:hypothetical protein